MGLLLGTSFSGCSQDPSTTAAFSEHGIDTRIEDSDSYSVRRAKEALAKGSHTDADLRKNLGKAYIYSERYDEALEQYLWILDEANNHTEFPATLKSALWEDLCSLADSHLPARVALEERRDATRQRILTYSGPDDGNAYLLVHDFTKLSSCVGQSEDIVSLFRQLSRLHGGETVRNVILKELVAINIGLLRDQGLSIEIINAIDVLYYARHRILWERQNRERNVTSDSRLSANSEKTQKRLFLDGFLVWYQLLLDGNRLEDANVLATDLLELQSDAETYHRLAESGLESSNPTPANVEHARNAVQLDDSNPGYLATLIELLYKTGNSEEALQIATDYIERNPELYRSRPIRNIIDENE